jgi:hypothetical protein
MKGKEGKGHEKKESAAMKKMEKKMKVKGKKGC